MPRLEPWEHTTRRLTPHLSTPEFYLLLLFSPTPSLTSLSSSVQRLSLPSANSSSLFYLAPSHLKSPPPPTPFPSSPGWLVLSSLPLLSSFSWRARVHPAHTANYPTLLCRRVYTRARRTHTDTLIYARIYIGTLFSFHFSFYPTLFPLLVFLPTSFLREA